MQDDVVSFADGGAAQLDIGGLQVRSGAEPEKIRVEADLDCFTPQGEPDPNLIAIVVRHGEEAFADPAGGNLQHQQA